MLSSSSRMRMADIAGKSKPGLAVILTCLPWLALLGWLAAVSWFLTDDAFINFRYVRNLLEGHGLVFNPGERVEGYSNFLWTLELAFIWRTLGIPPEAAAPWLSVAFTAGTIGALLWWIFRLTGRMALGLRHLCSVDFGRLRLDWREPAYLIAPFVVLVAAYFCVSGSHTRIWSEG